MKTKLTLLLAAGLLLGAATTQAQGFGHDRDIRHDRMDIRHDRQDIRRDRRDLRYDRADMRRDRHDLYRDRCY